MRPCGAIVVAMDDPPLTRPARVALTFMWLVLGGLVMAAAYALAGLVGYALVITAPYGLAALRTARWCLDPWGPPPRAVVADGGPSRTRRVIWLVTAVWWLALLHLAAAVLLTLTWVGAELGYVHARSAINLVRRPRAG